MIQLVALGVGILGLYSLNKYFDKKELKKRKEQEKKIWNNVFCPECGRRWKYHWYYPPGSRGEYQILNIKCHKCRKESDLWAYIPDEVQPPYERI